MKVISIDPAPTKEALAYSDSGEFEEVLARKLPEYCKDLSTQKDTLLCWDAPLTASPRSELAARYKSAYSMRFIEHFFKNKIYKFQTPGGISTLPYSGCPHWAITRASLGLPRIGEFEPPEKNLPFALLTGNTPPEEGSWVVETHPAVALWLWLDGPNRQEDKGYWRYKGKREYRPKLLELAAELMNIWSSFDLDFEQHLNDDFSDDKLDALIGFVLGKLFLRGTGEVILLGNGDTGAILLPNVPGLEEAFTQNKDRLWK